MKYMHDTRANKMEEGHDTIQAKKRAIHDDTQIGGESDPKSGGESDRHPSQRGLTAVRIL